MRRWLIWVQIYSFCYSNECYLLSDLSARGLWNGAFCAGRHSRVTLATPTCFCIYQLWHNPVCLPPHRHPSVWMYSTLCSSICFCPHMKRSIIICWVCSWCAASYAWANRGRALNFDHKSPRLQLLFLIVQARYPRTHNRFLEPRCMLAERWRTLG